MPASSSSSRTPPDAAEDDGVLMGFVYDPTADRSDLML
jgi:carotenoid cleavage dioxygenase-like enzyme